MLKGDHSVYFSVLCFITTKESRIVIDVVWTQLLKSHRQQFNHSVILRGYWARIQQSTTIRSASFKGCSSCQVCINKWMQAITNIMMQTHYLEVRSLHKICQEKWQAYNSKFKNSLWRFTCLSAVFPFKSFHKELSHCHRRQEMFGLSEIKTKQEDHGPQRSPEKAVQINKHI